MISKFCYQLVTAISDPSHLFNMCRRLFGFFFCILAYLLRCHWNTFYIFFFFFFFFFIGLPLWSVSCWCLVANNILVAVAAMMIKIQNQKSFQIVRLVLQLLLLLFAVLNKYFGYKFLCDCWLLVFEYYILHSVCIFSIFLFVLVVVVVIFYMHYMLLNIVWLSGSRKESIGLGCVTVRTGTQHTFVHI